MIQIVRVIMGFIWLIALVLSSIIILFIAIPIYWIAYALGLTSEHHPKQIDYSNEW